MAPHSLLGPGLQWGSESFAMLEGRTSFPFDTMKRLRFGSKFRFQFQNYRPG